METLNNLDACLIISNEILVWIVELQCDEKKYVNASWVFTDVGNTDGNHFNF